MTLLLGIKSHNNLIIIFNFSSRRPHLNYIFLSNVYSLFQLQALLSTNKYIYIFFFSFMYVITYKANKGIVVVVVVDTMEFSMKQKW